MSHLPHAIAFSAVTALLDADPGMERFAGSSFRDLTRVAASSAEMWSDIFLDNAGQVDAAIAQFIAALEAFRRTVAAGDPAQLTTLLLRARAVRQQWGAVRT
ncbi:MAG: prephenate dehydrogenase dimerization domain-containing protein [Candidatus Binatia bacterium]